MQIGHPLFLPPSFLSATTTTTFSHSSNNQTFPDKLGRRFVESCIQCLMYSGLEYVVFLYSLKKNYYLGKVLSTFSNSEFRN